MGENFEHLLARGNLARSGRTGITTSTAQKRQSKRRSHDSESVGSRRSMPVGMILEEGECLCIHTPKGETIKLAVPAGSFVTAQGSSLDLNLAGIHLA